MGRRGEGVSLYGRAGKVTDALPGNGWGVSWDHTCHD